MLVFACLFTFLLGIIVATIGFGIYGYHQVNKMKKAKQDLVEEVKKKAKELEDKTTWVKERLLKATQIAQTQQDLRALAEAPSKNGLHSKYKNGLITEISEMEKEKMAVLKEILDGGFNPIITVIHDGNVKEDVPLSDYVAAVKQTSDPVESKKPEAAAPAPAGSDDEPRKVGKFFVYKGGKDDGTSH